MVEYSYANSNSSNVNVSTTKKAIYMSCSMVDLDNVQPMCETLKIRYKMDCVVDMRLSDLQDDAASLDDMLNNTMHNANLIVCFVSKNYLNMVSMVSAHSESKTCLVEKKSKSERLIVLSEELNTDEIKSVLNAPALTSANNSADLAADEINDILKFYDCRNTLKFIDQMFNIVKNKMSLDECEIYSKVIKQPLTNNKIELNKNESNIQNNDDCASYSDHSEIYDTISSEPEWLNTLEDLKNNNNQQMQETKQPETDSGRRSRRTSEDVKANETIKSLSKDEIFKNMYKRNFDEKMNNTSSL